MGSRCNRDHRQGLHSSLPWHQGMCEFFQSNLKDAIHLTASKRE